ncbi:glycosyltransferase [Cesiribacter andamanensis]|uniref:Putative glycosyl transferase n=1 Tax=Cesiribacter andamanensis AMV16 TaxID=1279009 RepID=M7NRD2_9BACT|nr:glycosyltransferase [Cesiribacter andamanensis]EMR01074.1 putative glycosyl transferase [Cesiribacter andamanensis AMV16]
MKEGISIVICTYNGASRLPTTLQHLARQRVPEGINWEVLVVDNASTDASAQVARDEWNRHSKGNGAFSVVYQPVPGLSSAREMGFARSSYDFIIMCDDDNWLCDTYVATAFQIMKSNPSIGMLGGKGEFVYEEEPPAWLKVHSMYAGGPQAPQSGKVKENKLYGAGSVLRKSAYTLVYSSGFRSLLSDRMAAQLTSGGDHELCYALALAGYDIWYDERLVFKHFIAKDRLSWEYYIRYIRESASCFELLEPYKILLKHNSADWLSFYGGLTQSFFYHVKRFVPAWYHHTIKADDSPEQKRLREVRYVSLRIRLQSYFSGFPAIRRNFVHVEQLKRQFHAQARPGSKEVGGELVQSIR